MPKQAIYLIISIASFVFAVILLWADFKGKLKWVTSLSLLGLLRIFEIFLFAIALTFVRAAAY